VNRDGFFSALSEDMAHANALRAHLIDGVDMADPEAVAARRRALLFSGGLMVIVILGGYCVLRRRG
jgi:hypothetical protein